MEKTIKNNPSKKLRMMNPSNHLGFFLAICLIFLIVIGWIFSGWPQIWQNPPIPPKIQIAYAIQTGTPNGDISTGSWVEGVTGADADTFLYNEIDEVSADGDTTYIVEITTETTSEVSLASLIDPGVDTGHEIHVWMRSIGSGGKERLRVALVQGTTVIATSGIFDSRSDSYVRKTFVIDQADAVNITDYTDLRIRFLNQGLGNNEEMRVTKVEFEIPEVPVVGTITVGTTGTQTASMNIPSANQYVGGAFTFVRDTGTDDVTQIIVTETGTVSANLNLSNVNIYYETAVVCSYGGTETFFGTAASFDVSEKATINGTMPMPVGTTQVCVYVVLDVGSGAVDGQTLEIEISNPSTEVTVSTGTVSPATPVVIAGTTTLQVSVVPSANWREDEDISTSGVNKNENIRLRIEVANTGSEATDYDYRLEYDARNGAICGDDESFIAVPVAATIEHFEMNISTYVVDGQDTTVQLQNLEGYTFIPGKIVADPSNSSGNLTLPFENYTEIEFIFWATSNATDGGIYCFRTTNAGTSLDEYPVYPELQIAGP